MSCIIFDGKTFAATREQALCPGKNLRVITFVFPEDKGSVIYTKLKAAAAARLGIEYIPIDCPLTSSLTHLTAMIRHQSADPTVTGVMIQKPTKAIFNSQFPISNFEEWWQTLVAAIDPAKDVDGLTGKGPVLPATVRACLTILAEAKRQLQISDAVWRQKQAVVIGRSDIVGKPLATELAKQMQTVNFGKADLEAMGVLAYDIVVSAVGKPSLLTGAQLKEDVIVIDVGAPQGDVERASVEPKAAFLTPVPGGVGPLTVVSLMENIVNI